MTTEREPMAPASDPSPYFVAYVYPGWHPSAFRPEVDEWSLLADFQPYFSGHLPPPRPLDGPYDDRTPETAARQIALAQSSGIDAFLYFTYYDGSAFVMVEPMTAALGSKASVEGDFKVAGSWCVRLPHDRFPLPPRSNRRTGPRCAADIHPASGDLDARLIENSTASDLRAVTKRIDGARCVNPREPSAKPQVAVRAQERWPVRTSVPPSEVPIGDGPRIVMTLEKLQVLLCALAELARAVPRRGGAMSLLRALEGADLAWLSFAAAMALVELADSSHDERFENLAIKPLEARLRAEGIVLSL